MSPFKALYSAKTGLSVP